MGLFSKDIQSLDDLFLHGLQDIYYAENQIAKSLPTMIEKAHDADLKRASSFISARPRTRSSGWSRSSTPTARSRRATKCPAIDGILKEGDDLMGEIGNDDVMNVGIIAAGQAVEHYEITRYGALIAWARELGRKGIQLLTQNLNEEKATDLKLTKLAERRVNPKGAGKTRRTTSASRKTAGRKAAGPKTTAKKTRPAPAKKATRQAAARKKAPARKKSARR